MIDRTKPGSAMERVQSAYPKSYCYKYENPANDDMRFAVKTSKRNEMILATGRSAQEAWNKAAKAICP